MIAFRRVLCPVDFSPTSVRALTYAVALASWYDAQLDVLHVASGDHGKGRADGDRHQPEVIAGMRRAIDDTGGPAPAAVNLLVQDGRADEVIAAASRTGQADLVVMGTHGRTGFTRLLLGSVTERVMRTVQCPVLTVPPSAPAMTARAVTFKQILCGLDFSPSALRALEYALELGRLSGGCVSVLYALEYMDPEEPCEHIDFDIRQRRQHFLDHARARLHAQLAGEPTTWCELKEIVAIDRAYQAILKHAKALNADLIVMGAQGTGGLELMVYGSNAQHVVRSASCPVLTLHA